MSSLLQQYLGTNYVPSTVEKHEIKEILTAGERELREVDDEINQLKQELQPLLEEQSAALNLAAHYVTLLSPARRLNRDVLQEIFLACLPTDRNPRMVVTEAPMLLTHICSSWRSLAHSLPRLWSSVHIVIPSFQVKKGRKSYQTSQEEVTLKLERHQAGAIEWLERSRGYPLSISVYQTPDTSPVPIGPEYSNVLENELQLHASFLTTTLLPFCDRWQKIDFCLSSEVINHLFKNELNTRRTPQLRSLHIVPRRIRRDRSTQSLGPRWEFVDIVRILSSKLMHISALCCVLRKSDLLHIPLSTLGRVKELNLYSTYSSGDARPTLASLLDVIQNVLPHCQSLATLKISIYSVSNQPQVLLAPESVGMVTLPHLKHLTIGLSETHEPKPQLSSSINTLFLPSLEHFNVEVTGLKHYTDIVRVLLRNNGQSVRYLKCYGAGQGREEDIKIVELLQLTPNLKSLTFTSNFIGSTFNHWPVSLKLPRTTATRKIRVSENKYTTLVNDDLLHALSPIGKTYFEIICPQLEELQCAPKLTTMASASALQMLTVARQNAHLSDNRIASLERVCIRLDEYRDLDHTEETQAVFGKNANVHFNAVPSHFKPELSPFEGFVDYNK